MDPNSSLISAVKKGSQDEITTLILNGADVNTIDEFQKTPIIYAIENTDPIITRMLLTNGANVEHPKLLNIAIALASGEKSIKIIELLLEHGVDINATDECGRTPLHFTPLSKCDLLGEEFDPDYLIDDPVKGEIAELLLSKGANVNAKNECGETALHVAVRRGYSHVVEALLIHNVDFSAKTKCNIPLLHAAVQGPYTRGGVVRALLGCGADVNCIQEENGRTALHIACELGHFGVVRALLKCGADINITDKRGDTPLEIFVREFYYLFRDADSDGFYYDCERGVYSNEDVPFMFQEHMIEMKQYNLYINEKNLLWFIKANYNGQNDPFEGENEIQALKDEKLDKNVSFYDILIKNSRELAVHARNENIVKVLESYDFKAKFPIFGDMIKSNFRRGVARKEMLEQGSAFIYSLNNVPPLPCSCTEKILSYLSDKDLHTFIGGLNIDKDSKVEEQCSMQNA